MKGLDQSFLHEFFVSKIHYQRKTGFFPKMVNQNTLRVAEMKRLFNLVHTHFFILDQLWNNRLNSHARNVFWLTIQWKNRGDNSISESPEELYSLSADCAKL